MKKILNRTKISPIQTRADDDDESQMTVPGKPGC